MKEVQNTVSRIGVNEKKFYRTLEEIFTGAKIEGQGGFLNLIKIKHDYYQKVISQFAKEVEEDKVITNDFREEFFSKLYTFFKKYFNESGSIFFTKTANWNNVYEKIYTGQDDIVLFWKTHMLYYVKTDTIFNNLFIEVEDKQWGNSYFYFDVSKLDLKKNNEKRALVYEFSKQINASEAESKLGIKLTDNISSAINVIEVNYSTHGKTTKIENLVRKTGVRDESIYKAISVFEKQNKVDIFINKNAKKFLTEQLDIYLHQILLDDSNEFSLSRLEQIKTIKLYAKKLINFISNFENELVYIWNKPKFVLNSEYIISADLISSDIINALEKV
jgi:adenine-specific DNA-methyltransferase